MLTGKDAFVVKRLRDAGAIVIAKSNMAEFAFSPVETVNSILPGYTRNPHDTSARHRRFERRHRRPALAANFVVDRHRQRHRRFDSRARPRIRRSSACDRRWGWSAGRCGAAEPGRRHRRAW